jgi:hypothetical protein
VDEKADAGQGHEEERRPPDLNNQIIVLTLTTSERLSYQDVASRQVLFIITSSHTIASPSGKSKEATAFSDRSI